MDVIYEHIYTEGLTMAQYLAPRKMRDNLSLLQDAVAELASYVHHRFHQSAQTLVDMYHSHQWEGFISWALRHQIQNKRSPFSIKYRSVGEDLDDLILDQRPSKPEDFEAPHPSRKQFGDHEYAFHLLRSTQCRERFSDQEIETYRTFLKMSLENRKRRATITDVAQAMDLDRRFVSKVIVHTVGKWMKAQFNPPNE